MPKTLKSLYGPAALTTSAATKYTAPASGPTDLRHIHLSNTSAGSVTVTISIGTDAAGTRILDAYPMAASSILDLYNYVVPASTVVQALASSTAVVITIDGYEYTAG